MEWMEVQQARVGVIVTFDTAEPYWYSIYCVFFVLSQHVIMVILAEKQSSTFQQIFVYSVVLSVNFC